MKRSNAFTLIWISNKLPINFHFTNNFFLLGPRPPNVESCYIKPCSYDMNRQGDRRKTKGHVGIEVTYSWRTNGFTPCSASCLGGKIMYFDIGQNFHYLCKKICISKIKIWTIASTHKKPTFYKMVRNYSNLCKCYS